MNMKSTYFKDALRTIANVLKDLGFESSKTLVIRDLYGRIRVLLDSQPDASKDLKQKLSEQMTQLGRYLPSHDAILDRGGLLDFETIFNDPSIQNFYLPGTDISIRLLDRQIVGQEWLQPQQPQPGSVPRLVFYGLKGGVGRSTALAIFAYHLAQKGKRVLLIDFDLESPGLSSLLLPAKNRSEFGMVDWFVEDGIGQGNEILPQMISSSPIGQYTIGAIRVVAASGVETGDEYYLSKLSRAYLSINQNNKTESFLARATRLLTDLEKREKPDVVLIDSRAGLHDLAAISIVGLSTYAYLFATGSDQSWQGYRLLFSHWRTYPETLKKIRDRLVMVHALFPETDQDVRADRFLENSYTLFSETIYETIEPGENIGTTSSADYSDRFNFDLRDESAPHFPVRIRWNNSIQEFDPKLLAKNILSDELINAVFGDLLKRADLDLEIS